MSAGRYKNWHRLHVDAIRVRHMHPLIHLQQRHALAVDRDFDLFVPRGHAEVFAGRRMFERHAKHILTIGRKVVYDADAAAGTEWRAFRALPLAGIA